MADLAVSVVLKAVDKMTAPVRRIQRTTAHLSEEYRGAGGAAKAFADRQATLRHKLAASNRVMARQKLAIQSFSRLRGDLGGLTNQLQRATHEAGSLGLKLGVVAGLGAWGFKSQFVDTAAQFEKFQTILETTEGSSEKAKQAMDWVSNFATKTPYELAEVNEAFVKLRAYGMDPTNGLLQTLGNTSSAMGKDLIQAVEAIADAVTGENERLKEFGIKASTEGDTVTYAFTDRSGAQRSVAVNKNDRKAIEETLSEIFDQKYSGAMERLSRTWSGMLSNIADQWTRFANMVMEAGVFDFMKEKLSGILNSLNTLADNGQLQAYATRVAEGLIAAMKGLWAFGETLVDMAQKIHGVVGALGGWQPLLIGLTALMAGKFVLSVLLSAKALGAFGWQAVGAAKNGVLLLTSKLGALARAGSVLRLAFVVTPIGLLITALTVAVGLVVRFWDRIKAFGLGVMEGFRAASAPLREMFAPLLPLFSGLGELLDWTAQKLSALFTPTTATAAELGKAATAGKQFGEWLASGLALALTPLSLLIEGIGWVTQHMSAVTDAAASVGQGIGGAWDGAKDGLSSAWDWAFGEDNPGSSTAMAKAQAGTIQHNSTITVVQQPGEDGEALARRIVQEEMRMNAAREKTQQRGALFDYQENALP
ncbi:tape measure protein [Grimontia sp. SpTr1]|uniref:tape measure protein n=1 Tax=Grimontia sp. SpTr1 TaxID=2995319 RepID=UPI00248AD121|nr:tape measure protein [Grimontia sp. SpTr1]